MFGVVAGGQRSPRRRRRSIVRAAFAAALVFSVAAAAMLVQRPAAPGFDAASADRPRLHVIDGDTFADAASGMRYRLANIDTPETGARARCAAERRLADDATSVARAIIAAAESVAVKPTGRIDAYGRAIAYVQVNGQDLGALLVARDVARPWRGRREPWCDSRGGLIP